MSIAADTERILTHWAEAWEETTDYVTDRDPDSKDCIHKDAPWINIYVSPSSLKEVERFWAPYKNVGFVNIELYVRPGKDGPLRDLLVDEITQIFSGIRLENIKFKDEVSVHQKKPSRKVNWQQTLLGAFYLAT